MCVFEFVCVCLCVVLAFVGEFASGDINQCVT